MVKRANQTSKDRTQEQIAMTVRLPAEVHEALRTVAFAGGTSINDVVVRAVGNFLVD
jgi:predicted HicB family RNase H-like nuclease